MPDHPVAPEVFDFIDDFIERSSVWSVAGSSALDPESSVLAFCENFFAQFFENELDTEITSLSSVSAQRAGVLRRRPSTNAGQRRLIRRFQHLCKIHADLVGETYGSGGDERAEFFYSDLPALLADVELWARETDHLSLSERARRTIARYDKFLAEPPPS